MTTTTTSSRPSDPGEAATLIERAAALGPLLAANAERHDRERTFVAESYAALRDAGLLRAAVPVELGGSGATVGELAALQRELGRHCGATALASAMHQHVACFTAWRYRRGLPGAEATLRRIVNEDLLLISTGGGDFTHPRGTAIRVEGGYRVSGRKRFASQSRFGTVMSTMFVFDDPDRGRRVLNVAVPVASEGVTFDDHWDTLGMRGTASDDIVLEEVFVPDERVLADRSYGVIDPPLQVIATIGFSIVSGAYLGVAEAAAEAAIASVAERGADPLVQRQVGEMRHRLTVAAWALEGALALVGDDPQPSAETFLAVMTAKREIAEAGVAAADLALEIGGGAAFFTGSVIERSYRDIRAAKFHPLSPEETLRESGRFALGVEGLLA